jgi:hypothetical protein
MDNKWAQVINFCLTRVKEGYIIDFSIGYNDSLSEVKRKFDEGHKRRLLEETPMWIKMFFIEK